MLNKEVAVQMLDLMAESPCREALTLFYKLKLKLEININTE